MSDIQKGFKLILIEDEKLKSIGIDLQLIIYFMKWHAVYITCRKLSSIQVQGPNTIEFYLAKQRVDAKSG